MISFQNLWLLGLLPATLPAGQGHCGVWMMFSPVRASGVGQVCITDCCWFVCAVDTVHADFVMHPAAGATCAGG